MQNLQRPLFLQMFWFARWGGTNSFVACGKSARCRPTIGLLFLLRRQICKIKLTGVQYAWLGTKQSSHLMAPRHHVDRLAVKAFIQQHEKETCRTTGCGPYTQTLLLSPQSYRATALICCGRHNWLSRLSNSAGLENELADAGMVVEPRERAEREGGNK